MWILTSGLAQVGWELPFVLWKKDYLHSLRSTETLDPEKLWSIVISQKTKLGLFGCISRNGDNARHQRFLRARSGLFSVSQKAVQNRDDHCSADTLGILLGQYICHVSSQKSIWD